MRFIIQLNLVVLSLLYVLSGAIAQEQIVDRPLVRVEGTGLLLQQPELVVDVTELMATSETHRFWAEYNVLTQFVTSRGKGKTPAGRSTPKLWSAVTCYSFLPSDCKEMVRRFIAPTDLAP